MSPIRDWGGFAFTENHMFGFRSPLFGFAVAVVLALACGRVSAAEEVTIDNCKVVKVDGTKMTLETPNGMKHTADVAGDAKITVDGKDVKLGDLKEGTKIKITVRKGDGTATILKVEGTTK